MTNNKMTQKEMYAQIVMALNGQETVATINEMIEFVNGRVAQIDKKNSNRKSGLTETQKENLEIGKQILEFMKQDTEKAYLVSEIRKHFGLTSQKITPILTKMVENNELEKITDKRVNFYKVA